MDSTPETTVLLEGPAIAIRAQLALEELPTFFGGAFSELAACGAEHIAGPPFARYHNFDPSRIDVEAVIPLKTAVPVSGRIAPITLAGGPAVQIRHVGPFDALGETYRTLEQWLEDHNQQRADAVREVYLTEPSVPPDALITLVVQPLRHPDEPAS